MSTAHQDALEYATEKWLQDPEGAVVLHTCLELLKEGGGDHCGVPLRDIIVQKGYGPLDLYDARAFASIRVMLHSGELSLWAVNLKSEPQGNSEADYHNEVLGRLPSPYKSDFSGARGGGADDDGYLEWTKPIPSLRWIYTSDESPEPERITLLPRRLPLEVGSTQSSKTISHLHMRGGVARWPYGSRYMFILVNLLWGKRQPSW